MISLFVSISFQHEDVMSQNQHGSHTIHVIQEVKKNIELKLPKEEPQ